jgi:putative oxidoreductase
MREPAGSTIPKWRLRMIWALQLALAAVFAFTATRKFMGHPIPVATVEALGAGQWLRIAIGVAELAGAIGLLVPRLAGLAASCLALLMLGAVGTHLFVIGGNAVPALVLLAASATVAYLRGWRP